MPETTQFSVRKTAIEGLLEIDITIVEDNRGYFQEKFQKAKLVAAGLPESFVPVQQNITFNRETGTIRGIHAEPWEKYVSVITGKALGVFVDLKTGQKVEIEITPTKAVFIPRGIGNSFQTLEPNVYYQYFVSGHWQSGERYIGVNVADPDLNINWPINKMILSEKDRNLPMLKDLKL